jgi:hypothetical protein
MTDRVLAAAAQRCNDPERVMSTAGYASGFVDSADAAAAAAKLQADYDKPYRMWYRTPAPPKLPDESLSAYQRRLPQGLRRFSHTWAGQDFTRLDGEQLSLQAQKLRADVIERFERPEGPERSYTARDLGGREITRFFADEQAPWLPFTSAIADNGAVLGFKVGRIAAELGMGANSVHARAARAEEANLLALGRKAAAQQRAGAA